ncbi:MAG: hypothetical protein IJA00_02015 [Bacteroidaceae bacterium]|nr:hypothetical protein [Bacteroidaceae bacterium]
MKQFKYIAAALVIVSSALNVGAQTAKSSYFMDGAFHNTQINPAMKAERNFISFPVLGNMGVSANGNVGLSNFLHPQGDNELVTFMHKSVSADDFLGDLPSTTKIGMNFDMTLFALGFKGFGGYNTLNLTLRSQMGINLPKGMFEFMKRGFSKNQYSFSDLNVNSMNYAAITIGHSREIIDNLRVGVNLKYLIGLGYANFNVDKMNLTMQDDVWMAESYATGSLATIGEARWELDENGQIDDFDMQFNSPMASGWAVDLGATYDFKDLVDGLKVSASVTDLGFINWKHMIKAYTKDAQVRFEGFKEIDIDDFETSVEDQLDEIKDDAEEMMELYGSQQAESKRTNLAATMYLGAEYEMPFYKPLSVGILYTNRFSDVNGMYDFRGFLTVSPLKWFEASVNYGVSTYGSGFGWMLNFHPVGFSMFLGSDFMITDVSPQFVPVNKLNANFTFGISIPFGRRG